MVCHLFQNYFVSVAHHSDSGVVDDQLHIRIRPLINASACAGVYHDVSMSFSYNSMKPYAISSAAAVLHKNKRRLN